MKHKTIFSLVILVILLFSLSPEGSTLAQQGESILTATQGERALITPVIGYQGRLVESGTPVTGVRSMTFRLFNAARGGTQIWTETKSVEVTNGLFSTALGDTTAFDETTIYSMAQNLWLEIVVGATTLPRQRLMGAPYAFSLAPGADVEGSSTEGVLTTINTGSGGGLYASGTEYGVRAEVDSGIGLWGSSYYGNGVRAEGFSTGMDSAALKAENLSPGGISMWAKAHSTDATIVSSNDGTGPLFKAFGSNGGNEDFIIENNGDVKQDRAADGLVKAAVTANCAASGSYLVRSFNNVGGTITVSDSFYSYPGICVIDFGFDVRDRYVLANTVLTSTDYVYTYTACYPDPTLPNSSLLCFRTLDSDSGYDGFITVIVY
jgi:hypothetical protein